MSGRHAAPRRFSRRRTAVLGVAFSALLGVLPASASHPTVSLTDSDFEIDVDANLTVDHPAPSMDWAGVSETRKADEPSGSGDDSFGQGTKEDTAVPTVVDGSIPPNKSDLRTFGVFQETDDDGKFLHLFWTRVQDPEGTTNMDFEFNQSTTASSNGITPVRTAGDLLITYDLSKGGTVPVLMKREWNGSAWGPETSLSATNTATGSINASQITASDGLGNLDPRTFGEASIDLVAMLGTTSCRAFGSAYLKSRSSDSFTAALKDFIAPVPVQVSNCGSVRIEKTDDANPPSPLEGAVFTLYVDNPPVGGSLGDEDVVTDPVRACTTDGNGTCVIQNVLFGSYWVVETVTPPGHAPDPGGPQAISVMADEQVTVTFVNPRLRGAILVTKTRKHAASGPGDHPQSGVTFTVNGVSRATDENGKVCFDDLAFGSYTVAETVPAGYAGEGNKSVTVDNRATCADDPYRGETVAFSNTPLTDLTVSVHSQVPGGTASQIECTGIGSGDQTPDGFDDTSETFEDLPPGTYTCQVVIDP